MAPTPRGKQRRAASALLRLSLLPIVLCQTLGAAADTDVSVTVSCDAASPVSVLQGPPVGEGTDGVWVELIGTQRSPRLHLEPNAGEDFLSASMVASVGIATNFDQPEVGVPAEAARALTMRYCVVGLVSRAVVESTWTDGVPVTRVTATLPRGWAEAMRGMRAGERRLLLFSSDQNSGAEPIKGLQPNEPVALYVELLDVET